MLFTYTCCVCCVYQQWLSLRASRHVSPLVLRLILVRSFSLSTSPSSDPSRFSLPPRPTASHPPTHSLSSLTLLTHSTRTAGIFIPSMTLGAMLGAAAGTGLRAAQHAWPDAAVFAQCAAVDKSGGAGYESMSHGNFYTILPQRIIPEKYETQMVQCLVRVFDLPSGIPARRFSFWQIDCEPIFYIAMSCPTFTASHFSNASAQLRFARDLRHGRRGGGVDRCHASDGHLCDCHV